MLRVDREPSLRIAVLVGLFACACGTEAVRETPPNVVVIVLEGVRADHLSSYGYELPTTPNVDALCAGAQRFTRCRATSPSALASQASMLTGRFTYQHGAHPLLGGAELIERPLDLEQRTLAEVLGEAGYRSAAFVSEAEYHGEQYQLDQGFEVYSIEDSVLEGGAGLERNRKVFEWLHGVEGPFFLFVTYADARPPYNTLPLTGERGERIAAESVVQTQTLVREAEVQLLERGREVPAALGRELRARYDLGLANADLALGELVEHLRAADLLEETLLIVTADHGVFLGEHGLVGDSRDVYEQALHVPLVRKLPGAASAAAVEEALVSVADLPGLVAASQPPELAATLRAHFPLPLERDFSIAEQFYSRADDVRRYGQRFRRMRRVYYEGPHKLIRSSDGRNELYDLEADPGELQDLFDEAPDVAQELSLRLIRFLREHPAESEPNSRAVTDAQALHEPREVGHPAGVKGEGVGLLDDE